MILTTEEITTFKKLVEKITKIEDNDEYTELLNELYYSVNHDDFESFARTINDANDSDFRCPK